MTVKYLTCIECPIGCNVEVGLEGSAVSYVKGNGCPRGKTYAENEVICPMRVLTSTVRTSDGRMLPVKTDKPIRKAALFETMQKINTLVCKVPVKINDVLCENIADGANLIATAGLNEI